MSPRTIVRRQLIKSSLELISVIIGILPVTINSVFLCYGSTLLLEPVSVGSAVLNKLLKFKYLSRKENRDTKYPFILVLILEYLWINLVQNWKNEITNPQLIIFAYHYDLTHLYYTILPSIEEVTMKSISSCVIEGVDQLITSTEDIVGIEDAFKEDSWQSLRMSLRTSSSSPTSFRMNHMRITWISRVESLTIPAAWECHLRPDYFYNRSHMGLKYPWL